MWLIKRLCYICWLCSSRWLSFSSLVHDDDIHQDAATRVDALTGNIFLLFSEALFFEHQVLKLAPIDSWLQKTPQTKKASTVKSGSCFKISTRLLICVYLHYTAGTTCSLSSIRHFMERRYSCSCYYGTQKYIVITWDPDPACKKRWPPSNYSIAWRR